MIKAEVMKAKLTFHAHWHEAEREPLFFVLKGIFGPPR